MNTETEVSLLMRDQIPPISENRREQGLQAQKLRLLLALGAGPIAAEGGHDRHRSRPFNRGSS